VGIAPHGQVFAGQANGGDFDVDGNVSIAAYALLEINQPGLIYTLQILSNRMPMQALHPNGIRSFSPGLSAESGLPWVFHRSYRQL
jgi:hypothetical protein